MRKRNSEKSYLITYLSLEDGADMLEILKQDGPVHGIDCGGIVGVLAWESQLKKLTKAGVKWDFVSKTSCTR